MPVSYRLKGSVIARYLAEHGMSRRDFADHVLVDTRTVNALLQGGPVRKHTLDRVLARCNITLAELEASASDSESSISVPIDAPLLDVLEAVHKECRQQNVLFQTPHLLAGLFRFAPAYGMACFNALGDGVGKKILDSANRYLAESTLEYEPFLWEQRADVKLAARLAHEQDLRSISFKQMLGGVLAVDPLSQTVEQIQQEFGPLSPVLQKLNELADSPQTRNFLK